MINQSRKVNDHSSDFRDWSREKLEAAYVRGLATEVNFRNANVQYAAENRELYLENKRLKNKIRFMDQAKFQESEMESPSLPSELFSIPIASKSYRGFNHG